MNIEKEITERFFVSQGDHFGETFRIFPWQKKVLKAMQNKKVETIAVSMARGNGKTAFFAVLAALSVDGSLQSNRADVVLLASSFQQARILFRHTLAYLKRSSESLDHLKINDSHQAASIENKNSGVVLRAIAPDPQRAMGLACKLILLDEPSSFKPNQGQEMLDVLLTSLGKIPEGKLVALGTRPANEGHFFSKMLTDSDFVLDYKAAKKGDPFSIESIRKANPSLKYLPTLKKRIFKEMETAKKDGSSLQQFKALRLNQGFSNTAENLLLEADQWELAQTRNLPARSGPLVIGLDLGGSCALTAFCAYWPKTGRLETIAFFPTVPDLKTRQRKDSVGKLYENMSMRGELRTLGNRIVPVSEALDQAMSEFMVNSASDELYIVADRYRESELRDAVDEQRSGSKCETLRPNLIFRGQGFRDGSEDVRNFQKAVLENKVKVLPNLGLSTAISEARTISDASGNIKMGKKSQGGRRSQARDDLASAAVLAVSFGFRLGQKPKQTLKFAIV